MLIVMTKEGVSFAGGEGCICVEPALARRRCSFPGREGVEALKRALAEGLPNKGIDLRW